MSSWLRISLACIAAFFGSHPVTAQIDAFETVGRTGAGQIVLPVNQTLAPAGIQVELPGLRPQVMKLSPDGRLLATSGKTAELVILDPLTGKILQRVAMPSE